MKRVLVVEDDQAISNLIHLNLDVAGYETKQAFCSKDALALLYQQSFDLILLDVMLPDLDGFASPAGSLADSAPVSPANPDQSGVAASVNEQHAVNIAKAALKHVFDVEIEDGAYTLQTEYFDRSKNAHSYPGKSMWTVYWNKKQTEAGNSQIEFDSVFIDAQTGEILSMSSQNSTDPKAAQALSDDAVKKMVSDFVQSNKLTDGAAITRIRVRETPKKVIVAEINLDNGKGLTVLISTMTNKIIGWKIGIDA